MGLFCISCAQAKASTVITLTEVDEVKVVNFPTATSYLTPPGRDVLEEKGCAVVIKDPAVIVQIKRVMQQADAENITLRLSGADTSNEKPPTGAYLGIYFIKHQQLNDLVLFGRAIFGHRAPTDRVIPVDALYRSVEDRQTFVFKMDGKSFNQLEDMLFPIVKDCGR